MMTMPSDLLDAPEIDDDHDLDLMDDPLETTIYI
jgi:hypothetical protein